MIINDQLTEIINPAVWNIDRIRHTDYLADSEIHVLYAYRL